MLAIVCPPQRVLWCRRSDRQLPSLHTSLSQNKKSNIVHVITDLIPVIQGKRDKHPNTKENPRIQINDTAAWQLVQLQLVQLQLVPLAPEQAEVHPARKEEINKTLQRIQ